MTDEAELRARIEAGLDAPARDPSEYPDENEPQSRRPQPTRSPQQRPASLPGPSAAEPRTPEPAPPPDGARDSAKSSRRPRREVFSTDSTVRSGVEPDLSRFLAASEPREGGVEPDDTSRRPASLLAMWRRRRRVLAKFAIVLVVAATAALLLRAYVVAPYYIPSESMEPTLHGCTGCDDDHILVDKVSYRFHDPRQSDIVVFDKPDGVSVPPGEDVLIKRVIALPGDKIEIRKGRVIIDGTALEESYLNKDKSCYAQENLSARTIPQGRVFVMGDNRCDSTDSRVFGPIPESSIVGRAWLIIWPLTRIGTL